MMTATDSPYADSCQTYWESGWRSVLPVAYGQKKSPPNGYTGRDAATPSYADVSEWARDGRRNVALRMPASVIGLDVDNYDSKEGGDTLARLVGEYGALPPTWLSTSREDGISGIRFFRVPEGTVLPSALPGIELIQHWHRYAIVWPSMHPTGRRYQWINETDGTIGDDPPRVDDLPELPAAWVDGLGKHVRDTQWSKVDVGSQQVAEIVAAFPTGAPCRHVRAAAGQAMAAKSRHDAYNAAMLAVCGAGRRGCPGAVETLQRLRASFMAEVTSGNGARTQGEAAGEWARGLVGAVAIVATQPQGTVCEDDVLEWVANATRGNDQGEETAQGGRGDAGQRNGDQGAYEALVRRRAGELRLVRDARDLLAEEDAGNAKPLASHTLAAFLSQPDMPTRYVVDQLWPTEGRVLLAAAAKAGKTTMVTGNLLPALVDGGQFLNRFDVDPVSGNVALFNMEVGENTLRSWLRSSGIVNAARVSVINLRGRASALTLASEKGRQRVAMFLADLGATVAILDPLAPVLASLGLDENANADVARFFSWWSEVLDLAGVSNDLIVHHTGHEGKRSRGASRLLDEPDAIWTLTRDVEPERGDDSELDPFGPVTPRYFSAYGRDVEVGESGLIFDPATRKLDLVSGSRKTVRHKATDDAARSRVRQFVAANPGCTTGAVRESGGRSADNIRALEALIGEGQVWRDYAVVNGGTAHLHYLNTGQNGQTDKVVPGGSRWFPVVPEKTGTGCGVVPPGGTLPEGASPGNHRPTTERNRENEENLGNHLKPCETCNLPALTNPCSTCRAAGAK